MGLLRKVFGGMTALTAGGAFVVILTSASCQLVAPVDGYYDPNGITSIVFYPSSDAPSHLVSAGDYLIYEHGLGLYRVPKSGGSPELIRSLRAPVASLAYDGEHTIAYCDSTGALGSLDTNTFATVDGLTLSDAGESCLQVAIDPSTMAYTADWGDAGTMVKPRAGLEIQTVAASVSIADGGRQRYTVTASDDAAVSPLPVAIAVSSTTVVLVGENSLMASFDGGVPDQNVCRVAIVGNVVQPRIAAFTSDAGTSVVLQGAKEALRHLDVGATSCCPPVRVVDAGVDITERCLLGQNYGQIGTSLADFAVHDGFVYWSENNFVSRHLLSASDYEAPDAAVSEPVASIPGDGVTISELVVDDSYVFCVVGARILRVPLPAHL